MTGAASGTLALQIDAYCERTSFAFWAEPVNALTNLAFIAAALLGWHAARRAGQLDAQMLVLVTLTIAIGAGSSLFHTFATRWAALADVVPIAMFIVAYLTLALRGFLELRWSWALAIGAAWLPLSWVIAPVLRAAFGGVLGSSIGYLPAALALAACAAILLLRRHPAGPLLTAATAAFALSLTARTLDGPLCAAWPLGTHFLWHLLNGAVLALLLLAMARHRGPRPDRRPEG